MTSCAPVLAFSTPTIQPSTAPPANAPSTQTMTWMTGGRLTPKPSQVARMAPPMNWLAAPMLNRPARNASATDRPVRISGVALTAVSDSGLNTALTQPSCSAVASDSCWKSAASVCGLKMAPSKMAT